MTVEGFKRIYYVEWLHRLIGNTLGVLFFAPMTYFWARGYLKPKMKVVSGALFCLVYFFAFKLCSNDNLMDDREECKG